MPSASSGPIGGKSDEGTPEPEACRCLEDGKPFKSLKRHLSSRFDMTPEAYWARWGLPSDYPMVAPGYSAKRSALALSLGLGRKPTVAAEAEAVAEPAGVEKPKRGRKPKAAVPA